VIVAAVLAIGLIPFAARAQTSDASDVLPAPSGFKGAFVDSLHLLMIEHSMRIAFQDKTRRELGGNFWGDYMRSVKMPDGWEDGDGWGVNYVGHPMHGAAAGFIWLDHVDGAHDPDVGFSIEYWASRGMATAWAAAYSYQFEFGPLSEASIGNVGMHPGTSGWVDHVVTPAGAFGVMVAEDALDRYLITWIEQRTANRFYRGAVRVVFNPSRTLSNMAEGRTPWARAVRPLNSQQ
jgi:hypothetical protein